VFRYAFSPLDMDRYPLSQNGTLCLYLILYLRRVGIYDPYIAKHIAHMAGWSSSSASASAYEEKEEEEENQ
jgi:hypothetical protein